MTDPLVSVSRDRSVRRYGCLSVLVALVMFAALMWPVGVWARFAWWFLDSGWSLFDL